MKAWARLHCAGEEYAAEIDYIATSDDANAVVRWALSRSRLSSQPGVALRMLANAPSWLLLEAMDEVVRLVVEDNHLDEARHAIAAIGPCESAPRLLRAIDALLAKSELNIQEYLRLTGVLRALDAKDALKKVIDATDRSRDPCIRASGGDIRASGV